MNVKFALVAEHEGSHVTVVIFAGGDFGQRSIAGTLRLRLEEWTAFKMLLTTGDTHSDRVMISEMDQTRRSG